MSSSSGLFVQLKFQPRKKSALDSDSLRCLRGLLEDDRIIVMFGGKAVFGLQRFERVSVVVGERRACSLHVPVALFAEFITDDVKCGKVKLRGASWSHPFTVTHNVPPFNPQHVLDAIQPYIRNLTTSFAGTPA